MNPIDVNPGKWGGTVEVLFDNGWFSVCQGEYEGSPTLGMRYNGDSEEPGYPKVFAHPVWFVVPEFLHEAVLLTCLKEAALTDSLNKYIPEISKAIQDN